MKIYVINLLRSIDRLIAISRQSVKFNFSFERVDAIDGKKLNFEPTNTIQDIQALRCVTKSEIACNWSHAKALELIANGDEDYGIILEDDAILSPKCEYFFKNTDWIPANTNLIKLDTGCKKVLFNNARQINAEYKLYDRLTNDYRATGYLVSKEAARWLAAKIYETNILIDVIMYNFVEGMACDLNAMQLYPAIVTNEDGNLSTITHAKRHRTLWKTITRLPKHLAYKRYLQRFWKPHQYICTYIPFLK